MERMGACVRVWCGAAGFCLPVLLVGLALVAEEGFAAAAEAPPQVPLPVSFSATLVGSDGKPLPMDGVFTVTKLPEHGEPALGELMPFTPNIRQGVFTITKPPGKYELEVYDLAKKGFYLKGPATFEIKPGEPAPPLSFAVAELVPLNILVQDSITRKFVQGAGVFASFGKTGAKAFSDVDGKVRFLVIPGLVKVGGSDDKHEPAYKTFDVSPEGASFTFELVPYVTLSGKVMASNGKPVTKSWVTAWSKREDGSPSRTETKVKDGMFSEPKERKGPCIVVVDAEGLAPVVEPLVLVGDTERTFTLSEGHEVTFNVNLDPSFLVTGTSGRPVHVPTVTVVDVKTGIETFCFTTAPTKFVNGEDKQSPVTELKTRLSNGKYKIVCDYKGRFFVVEEIDLKGPRTIVVDIKKTTVFDVDAKDFWKDVRFPQAP